MRKLVEQTIENIRKEAHREDFTDEQWEFEVNADLRLLDDEQVLILMINLIEYEDFGYR
jgi:hypothetical protein